MPRSLLSEQPFISVIIPVRNEAAFIAGTLAELLDQDYPPSRYELLICDGESDDDTRTIVGEIAELDPRVRLLDNPRRRSSAGRNTGFRAGRGEIMVVVDGHVHIGRRNYLSKLAEQAQRSNADCLGRPQPLLPVPGSDFSEALANSRASKLGHSPSSFIFSEQEGFAPAASMGAAYRRHVFERIGFVDESFDACEDLEFNTRLDAAGMSCWTSPELTVFYYARTSLRGLLRQMFRYGFGRFKYMVRHPRTISIYQLVPTALTAGLLIWPVSSLLWPVLGSLGACVYGLYLILVVLEGMRLAQRTTWSHLGRYLIIFPAIHFGLGLGTIISALRGGRLP